MGLIDNRLGAWPIPNRARQHAVALLIAYRSARFTPGIDAKMVNTGAVECCLAYAINIGCAPLLQIVIHQ